ncbi:MAG TPA: hypothetical protein VFY25_04845 [Anaerolineales bacterium]|nr:hypothetical protein [Anaerolineales bacterium]
MKVCTKCKIEKDESQYAWALRGIKKHSACNSCRVKERMDYYKRNKERELEYKWDRQLKKREQAREFVDAYKRSGYCADCGTRDPDALTFDHVRGTKKMNIANMVSQGYSIGAIKAEISKCELRCFNCHMKAERQRRR